MRTRDCVFFKKTEMEDGSIAYTASCKGKNGRLILVTPRKEVWHVVNLPELAECPVSYAKGNIPVFEVDILNISPGRRIHTQKNVINVLKSFSFFPLKCLQNYNIAILHRPETKIKERKLSILWLKDEALRSKLKDRIKEETSSWESFIVTTNKDFITIKSNDELHEEIINVRISEIIKDLEA